MIINNLILKINTILFKSEYYIYLFFLILFLQKHQIFRYIIPFFYPYIIIFIFIVYSFFKYQKQKIIINKIGYLFFALNIYYLFISIFSKNFFISIEYFLISVIFYLIYYSSGLIFQDFKTKKRLMIFFILTTTLLSLLSFVNFINFNYVNKNIFGLNFTQMYFGHNHLASLLIYSISFLLYFLFISEKKINKFFLFIFFILNVFFLFLTYARGAILSLLISFFVIFIVFKIVSFKKNIFLFILSIAFSFTIFFYLTVVIGPKYFVYKPLKINKVRLLYFQNGLNEFQKNIFFGNGLNINFYNELPSVKYTNSLYSMNFFIQALKESGLIGFFINFILIFSIFKNWFIKIKLTKKIEEKYLYITFLIPIFASFINSQFDFTWQIPAIFSTFMLFSGIIENYEAKR